MDLKSRPVRARLSKQNTWYIHPKTVLHPSLLELLIPSMIKPIDKKKLI